MTSELTFARTRIQAPRVRNDLIQRPALEAGLKHALAEQRLTLIVAPAGWGKTSSLARQIAQLPSETALAWLTADVDDDLPRFLAGLTAALAPFDLPWRVAPTALANLLQSERGPRAVADEIVNALSDSEVSRGLLVIDDVHRWQDPRLFELLAAVIDHAPSHWGIVLSSRTEPALPTARWRARGELAEFRQSTLRFRVEEIRDLLHSRGLEAGGAEELEKRTQGWAVGLRLMLSVGNSALHGSGRSQRDVFDYLATEVLEHMAPDMQQFLLRCSVLPELTSERCAHVSELPNAAALFDHVEREGLFVSPLDEAGRTLRLHDLFREFLAERLRREHATQIPGLLQRAAEDEPDLVRAVSWLIRAGAHDRAAAEMAARGPALIHVGGRPAIERLLALFPPGMVEDNPQLSFLRGQCAYQAFDFAQGLEAMTCAARGFDAQGHFEMALVARTLANACGLSCGQLSVSREERERVTGQKVSGSVGALFQFVLAMEAYANSQQAEVVPAVARMIAELETVPQHPVWAEIVMMTIFPMLPGALPHMERFDRAAAAFVTHEASILRATLMHCRAIRDFAAGRIADAYAWLSSADDDMQWLGKPISLRTENFMLHMIIDAVRQDTPACQQAIAAAFKDLATSSLSNQRSHSSGVRSPAARALFALGDASALRELRTVMQHARNDTEWKSAHEEQRLVDGMVALIDNEPARAESLLEPGGEPLCWSTYGVGATALVLCAEAQRRQGKLDAAASSLARLIRESDSTQRTGPALLAGPGILKTLASTSWGRRLSDADQAELSRWAAIASGDLTGGVESINSSELPAGLSEREAEVLDLITKGHSNKLIARDLSLSLFTVKRHVANILGKTELTSRTELATWWLGQQKSH